MFGIGAGEFVVILIVGLIVFGPEKLPELGKTLGKGLKEFRKAQAAFSATLNEVSLDDDKKNSASSKDEKKNPIEKVPDEKISEELPSQKNFQSANVTADDVINLAKQNPIKEQKLDEENSNGGNNFTSADNSLRNAAAAGSTDSTGK